jgi:peptide/nickel transport system ATP-binding protein
MVAAERPGLPSTRPGSAQSLLRVEDLVVCFGSDERPLPVVDGVSFDVRSGETVCLVGESGSGKTLLALSILRLEEHRRARIVAGSITFGGRALVGAQPHELQALRGRRVAMIFQEPMTALDPVFSIGEQLVEAILRHTRLDRTQAFERAVRLLERVHIPDARLRMRQIPEELSGGMRQRVVIAMALSCSPDLLIADEPTTALDVTTQAQILSLLRELQRETGMAILLITHDLGVAAMMADRVVVMYAGRIVERAAVAELFADPRHPYTRALLGSAIPLETRRGTALHAIQGAIPRLGELPAGCRFHPRCPLADARCRETSPPSVGASGREVACFNAPGAPQHAHVVRLSLPARHGGDATGPGQPLHTKLVHGERALLRQAGVPRIEAVGVSKHFGSRGLFARQRPVRALDDVSLSISAGETFGLVGESGCGKSTLGRVLLRLEAPSAGVVRFDGRAAAELGRAERQRVRREMQMIFQDPHGSLDPRWSVEAIIAEPLVANGESNRQRLRSRVEELLELVGLPSTAGSRYAHELSGGQRQRIGIARALAQHPKFVVADEAVSALDLSVQAQIINLLLDLRQRLGLTSLFIGHGLNIVRHLSDRVGVMYLGRLVEVGDADELFRRPAHHYTHGLLAAVPSGVAGERREPLLVGELPSPTAPPSGCHFHPRCRAATPRCRDEAPRLRLIDAQRLVACHHPRD